MNRAPFFIKVGFIIRFSWLKIHTSLKTKVGIFGKHPETSIWDIEARVSIFAAWDINTSFLRSWISLHYKTTRGATPLLVYILIWSLFFLIMSVQVWYILMVLKRNCSVWIETRIFTCLYAIWTAQCNNTAKHFWYIFEFPKYKELNN